MIYQCCLDLFSKSTVPLADNQSHIFPKYRIEHIDSVWKVADDFTLTEVSTSIQKEMVGGMIPIEDLTLFVRDRKGAALLRDYIAKAIDNIYRYADAAAQHRKQMAIQDKITKRKKVLSKIEKQMPHYVKMVRESDLNKLTPLS